MSERHLVTGGAGFIGSNLVHALLDEGLAVRILDDFSTGRPENLADVAADVEVVRGDVRDPQAVAGAVRGADVVYHQAAIASVARSVEDPVSTHDADATGTLNVLVAARDAGVARVVYASSASCYGDTEVLPVHEDVPTKPRSPYGVAKLAGEFYCRAFAVSYGLPTVALRYFNIFGPRQDPNSEYAAVVPTFSRAAIAHAQATIYGDGEQTRDFTFVEHVVQANRKAASAPEQAFGECFNIGQGGRTTVNELLRMLQAAAGGEQPEAIHEPARPSEARHSQADISRARAVLGYEPTVPLDEALRRTFEWFRDHQPVEDPAER